MLSYVLFNLDFSWSSALVTLILVQLTALVLDYLLGEPRKFHPLVGFGYLVQVVENRFNIPREKPSRSITRLRGCLAWALLVLPITFCCLLVGIWLAGFSQWLFWLFGSVLLYLTLGLRSLSEHACFVSEPLLKGDLDEARSKVAWLVSRETKLMDTPQINKACIESILENGNDAVVGALFWFLVAGPPGALLYRLANTLDANWGYRTERHLHFGWWAARADDWMNYIPARICALAYSFCGHWSNALESWRRVNLWRRAEGRNFASPNAGPVMASGAGALDLELGGEATYQGERVLKPPLGSGRTPVVADISAAVELLFKSVVAILIFQTLLAFLLLWLGE